jgi:hypothetical protein
MVTVSQSVTLPVPGSQQNVLSTISDGGSVASFGDVEQKIRRVHWAAMEPEVPGQQS